MKPRLILSLLASLLLAGCSATPLFPPEAMTDVSSPEFGVLQAKTDVFKGRVVQLAGRIVGIEESANGTIILARELPVEKHPVFGPAETNKPMKAFAVLYPGKVDSNALWFGNKFIVVAVAKEKKHWPLMGFLAQSRTWLHVACMCGKPGHTVHMRSKITLIQPMATTH